MSAVLDHIPVTAWAPPGHYGRPGTPGVTARIADPEGAVLVAARRGQGAALMARAQAGFGLALVDAPQAIAAGDLTALGTGPGRWLVLSETAGDLLARLHPLAECGALTAQTDASVQIDLAGPDVRNLLAKGVTVDLDPAVFVPGAVATTNVAHINVTLWRDLAGERFHLLVGRSYAAGILRFLVASGAEYGLELTRG